MAQSKKPRPEIKPVTFVPIEKVFKPQILVQATRDINGWADREKKIKWTISHGDTGYMDIDTARQFQVKGYVRILGGAELLDPVSKDEEAEIMSTVTTLTLGVNPNG